MYLHGSGEEFWLTSPFVPVTMFYSRVEADPDVAIAEVMLTHATTSILQRDSTTCRHYAGKVAVM
jgi:hypothetical protein